MKLAAIALMIPLLAPPAAQAQLAMTPTHIGPVRAGMPLAEIKALGLKLKDTAWHQDDAVEPQVDIEIAPDVVVSAVIAHGMARRIFTASSAFATPEGARVGQTYGQIASAYPMGERILTQQGAGRFSHGLDQTHRAGFAFDPWQLPEECLRPRAFCPDEIATAPSIGYFIETPARP